MVPPWSKPRTIACSAMVEIAPLSSSMAILVRRKSIGSWPRYPESRPEDLAMPGATLPWSMAGCFVRIAWGR